MQKQKLINWLKELWQPLFMAGAFVSFLIALEFYDSVVYLGRDQNFGILPREMTFSYQVSFFGIGVNHFVFSILNHPFEHADMNHVLANAGPLFVFSILLLLRQRFLYVFVGSTILTGLGVWLLARSGTNHFGASGILFAFWSYLLVSGFFLQKWKYVAISVGLIFVYGTLIYSLLNFTDGISYEAHIIGFLVGILLAYIERRATFVIN